jgi:hypothetical protein
MELREVLNTLGALLSLNQVMGLKPGRGAEYAAPCRVRAELR